MILSHTKRPRNVDAPRAAAILYGDWGTSKAYVIGLAFAVAGYASFWLILPMCVLVALVGLNYIVICRHYPDGGGVYASVRHRSEIISLVGAFLLIADYLVTAAISALAAFQWEEDDQARLIFDYAAQKADGHRVLPCYAVSDSVADTIADVTATVGASELLLGAPTRSALIKLLRGNIVRDVADILPEDIRLLVAV